MIGKIRNKIDKICLFCGSKVVIYELNDSSPCRCYDSVLCPKCQKKIHEDYIVGEFVAELKHIGETNLNKIKVVL